MHDTNSINNKIALKIHMQNLFLSFFIFFPLIISFIAILLWLTIDCSSKKKNQLNVIQLEGNKVVRASIYV